jgi:hypothetical protein
MEKIGFFPTLISTNFDRNNSSISNYFSTFSIYLGECFPFIRIIGLGQVNKTSVRLFKFDFAKVYDKAIVVNTWRAKVNQLIDIACPCYDLCI